MISEHLAAIASICERYRVRRLELFGSATQAGEFGPESDADFLIEFGPAEEVDLHRFFGVKSELEALLGLPVDLVEAGSIRNPFVLAEVNRSRQGVYGT